MVSIGRSYWLGSDEADSWMRGMGQKFSRSEDVLAKVEAPGPLERERRRRSGTRVILMKDSVYCVCEGICHITVFINILIPSHHHR